VATRILRATEDLGDPGNGTQPRRLVKCGSETYRIKWPDDPRGEKPEHKGIPSGEMFSEVLACSLAPLLGISVPPHAMVDVPTEMFPTFNEGPCFGSLCMSEEFEPIEVNSHVVTTLSEYDELAVYSLFTFDILILNPDRKAEDLLRSITSAVRPRRFLAIDHSNTFCHSHWDAKSLHEDVGECTTYKDKRLAFSGLPYRTSAAEAVARITLKPIDFQSLVHDAAATVPIGKSNEEAASDFLQARFKSLPELVERTLRNASKA
jgi:hypothetical protein